MIEGSTAVQTGTFQTYEEMCPLEEGPKDNTVSYSLPRKPLGSIANELVVNGIIHSATARLGRFAGSHMTDEQATGPFIDSFLAKGTVLQIFLENKVPYWSLDSTSESLEFKLNWFPQESFSSGMAGSPLVPIVTSKPYVKSQLHTEIERTLVDFGNGLEDWVCAVATHIAKVSLDKTVEPEITVDVDGALSFDLRLTDGRLVLAELEPGGTLDASVYDQQGSLVTRLRQVTEADLVALF